MHKDAGFNTGHEKITQQRHLLRCSSSAFVQDNVPQGTIQICQSVSWLLLTTVCVSGCRNSNMHLLFGKFWSCSVIVIVIAFDATPTLSYSQRGKTFFVPTSWATMYSNTSALLLI